MAGKPFTTRKQTNAKIRDSSPISTREAITAFSVANAPCGGKKSSLNYREFQKVITRKIIAFSRFFNQSRFEHRKLCEDSNPFAEAIVYRFLPPQGALATEEAVIASRVDIGLESRNFVAFVFVCVLSRKAIRNFSDRVMQFSSGQYSIRMFSFFNRVVFLYLYKVIIIKSL